MDKLIAKASVLLEALPYIQRFAGKTVVIKYGGNAMTEKRLQSGFAEDVVLLRSLGLRPVIVHGGGPQITRELARAGIETRFVRGMRVTDPQAMRIIEKVLGGVINRDIVHLIRSHGGRAKGFSGKAGGILKARKLRLTDEGLPVADLGMVGEVSAVRPRAIKKTADDGIIPVIAPVGVSSNGRSYNINADTVAAAVARAMGAAKLMILTDVAGIRGPSHHVQTTVSIGHAREQIRSGVIAGGMVPKVECAMAALAGGVEQVHIVDGRVKHAVLLEIFTRKGVGTEVVLKDPGPAATVSKKTGP